MSSSFPFFSHRTQAEVIETLKLKAALDRGKPLTPEQWGRYKSLVTRARENNPPSLEGAPVA